jgi:hypothetical protein
VCLRLRLCIGVLVDTTAASDATMAVMNGSSESLLRVVVCAMSYRACWATATFSARCPSLLPDRC